MSSGTRPDRPGAEQWLPEERTPASLGAALQECRGCELYADATQAVPGDGPPDARLMLVGEQPGDREDRAGEPFVGPAGRLLDEVLEEVGIDPATTYRTNVVKHFRFSGTRGKQRIHQSPNRVHVAACGPWLLAELDMVSPAGVVLLGGTAGGAVYGSRFRVGESRGHRQDWPEEVAGRPVTGHRPAWVVPTTHPAAVLRSRDRDTDRAALVADLAVAARLLGAG